MPPTGTNTERPVRKKALQHVFEVVRVEPLSASMVRIHLGGPAFENFIGEAAPEKLTTTDKYVKLLLPRPGVRILPPFDLEELRRTLDPEDLPVRRTYTVRSIDREARTIAIDFVIHGEEGVAGPWAAKAKVGDLLAFSGPGGKYAPTQDTGVFHLFLGDETALPAIAAALEALPTNSQGSAVLEVGNADDMVELRHPAGIEIIWLHRNVAANPPGDLLIGWLAGLARPAQPVEVFAHGERAAMKRINTVLVGQWALDRSSLSLSPYWAQGRTEDKFQAEKRLPAGALLDA